MKRRLQSLALALLAAVLGYAGPATGAEGAGDIGAKREIIEALGRAEPRLQVLSVEPSPLRGFYQVEVDRGPTLLFSADGRYFVSGDLYTTSNGKLENLSEEGRKGQRLAQLAAHDDGDLIVFRPEQDAGRWIAVFTDVKCGYCRKFHRHVPQINQMGVEVRYFSFPIFDGSRERMVSALCSEDRQQALTALKRGETVPSLQCDNQTIDAQLAVGRAFGVSGTPAIVLDDGTLIKGYVTPDQLAQRMGL